MAPPCPCRTIYSGTMYVFILFVQPENVFGLPDVNAARPNIISRSDWHARPANGHELLKVTPTPYVIVHHGGSPQYCHNKNTCSQIVKSYQNYHMNNNGWADIGYNFIIGEDGNVYEGRGWKYVGAHAPGYNANSIGICIIGDFTNRLPNEAALKALNALISYGVSKGSISHSYHVLPHRQVTSTACPGTKLYEYVKKLPRWTNNPTIKS
ncbi:hypothetical protein E2986_14106 [Frieseomelitta varia]|uniref:Peptidoglycan-recognition protein n=1 Tax=Frieseomelitta varia TaxID=561572 RepID=A0A833VZ31_9HYME|nr:hypothetical protein E2986_14106 [Frieseomelitta varia]